MINEFSRPISVLLHMLLVVSALLCPRTVAAGGDDIVDRELAARLQELGYAIAIHPSNLLMRATFGMLQSLCELNGSDVATHLPTSPADFFNLVGMGQWLELDARYAHKDKSWA